MKEGSFSVEAALIMPIVIFMVLSLVFYSFYLRDIVLAESVGRSFLTDMSGPGSDVDDIRHDSAALENRCADTRALLDTCLWWGTITKWELDERSKSIDYEISVNIFGFRMAAGNAIVAVGCADVPDRLRLFKSIAEEAEELIFIGGSKYGG